MILYANSNAIKVFFCQDSSFYGIFGGIVMIIIVDAYNLLHAMPGYKKTMTDKERSHFIAHLAAYGRRKNHKMIIVFDRGPYEWPFKENMKTVQVIYSGMHQTADDYIKEYIKAHKAQDILLVSSDSELNRHAQYHTISSIDSALFSRLLHEDLATKNNSAVQKKSEVVKLVQDDEFGTAAQEMLDKIMTQASKKIIEKSEDYVQHNKVENKNAMSKEERILLKKLKKL